MNIEKLREESVKYMYDLTEEKIKKLKLVNKGTDAKLYKLSTNLLLKLYYTDKKVVLNNNDDDGSFSLELIVFVFSGIM